jgi:hypothetical protein
MIGPKSGTIADVSSKLGLIFEIGSKIWILPKLAFLSLASIYHGILLI